MSRGRGIPVSQVRAKFGGGRLLDAKLARTVGMVDRIENLDRAMSLALPPTGGRRAGATNFGMAEPAASKKISARRRRLKLEKYR